MKNSGFFRTHIVFSKKKTREQKHNSKDSFSIISIKKQLLLFLDTSKRTVKKRETDLKRRIKKGELHKNEKPFFLETEKTKHGKMF